MAKQALAAAALFGMGTMLWSAATTAGGGTETDERGGVGSASAIEGKTILVIASVPAGLEADSKTYLLQDAEVALIGDRWFFCGKPVQNAQKPLLQLMDKLAIACENVIEFSTFTPEGFARFTEESRRSEEDE